jgi:hypothetical protein
MDINSMGFQMLDCSGLQGIKSLRFKGCMPGPCGLGADQLFNLRQK